MRLSFIALAFATSAFAQTPNFDILTSPAEQTTYTVGDTLPIVWTPGTSTGTVTLTLIGGLATNALNPVVVIAAGVESQTGSYSWPIPATVGSLATYGVNLTSDADPSNTFQYSFAFHIINSNPSSSAASTVSSAASSIIASATETTASSLFSSLTSTPVASSTAIPTTIASATALTTLATASATAIPSGIFPSNSTTSSNTTATSKPIEPTTAGAGNLKVTGALALISGLVFALAL